LNFVAVIRDVTNSTTAVCASENVCRRKSIGLEILELKLKLIVNGNLAKKKSSIIEADEK
jgi:hypothetical protein